MQPAGIAGITQRSEILIFKDFYTTKDLEITINGKGYTETGSTTFTIKKVENPTYKDGIWVLAHDLSQTPCSSLNDQIYSYGHKEYTIANLDGLTSREGWASKMDIFSTLITTMNVTMMGFINIETEGDYTFYLQTGNKMYGRVVVNSVEILSDWEQCNDWSETPLSNTTKLEKGYAAVYIELRGGQDLDFKFVLQYSTPGDSSKKTIPFKYVQPRFEPVSFLTIDAQKISWLNDAFSLTPIHFVYGTASECEVTGNDLPEGSVITTNGITGHPQKDMEYKTYKMTCKNDYSVTNEITFELRVTSKFLNGLVAYYYKPYNFDTSLKTKYGPSVDGLEPSFIQIVDDAFVIEGDGINYPEGTTIEFLDDYAVYFEGYLKIGKNQEGLYNFKLQGEGGYWLYIDNKLIVEKPGRNSYSEETIVDFELTDDYYFYQIYYVAHQGDAHFEIISKLSTSDEWTGFLTDVFVPSYDYFVFRQRYATYLVGSTVDNPIIEVGGDSITCKSVTVVPELPAGLMAGCSMQSDASARIGGTAQEYAELWTYEVTIEELNGNKHTYPIDIRVKCIIIYIYN